jgi:putative aldouronate transport system permease protein
MIRRPVMIFLLITMYFSGGLIPTYLLVKWLGLVNTVWCMILGGALSVYNMLIMRSYFMNSIPVALQEAALLDGANSFQYLVRIVLPLSKPVMAVIALYYAIGHWNDYFTALVYIHDESRYPLQLILKEIMDGVKAQSNDVSNALDMTEKVRLAQSIKYSSIIVATIPVMIFYPFIQKYFVKGVMIGAVKG